MVCAINENSALCANLNFNVYLSNKEELALLFFNKQLLGIAIRSDSVNYWSSSVCLKINNWCAYFNAGLLGPAPYNVSLTRVCCIKR